MKRMAMYLSLLIGVTSFAEAKTLPKPLGVKLQGAANYQCADNTKLNVRYYTLSDNSLAFVKVKLNDKQYTLPQVVSASGAKYSDDMHVTWWTKGNEGTVFEQNAAPEENWPATHEDCREIKTK